MTNTNRFLNRLLLLIVGIVTILAGLLAAAVALVGYKIAGGITFNDLAKQLGIANQTVDLTQPVLYGVIIIAAVLAVIFLLSASRRGRGRTGKVYATVDKHDHQQGAIVHTAVASQLLEENLRQQAEFISAHVSAYEVQHTSTLKIQVQCRRGVSPTVAADKVVTALRGLDMLLGIELPALILVNGGFRAQHSEAVRFDS